MFAPRCPQCGESRILLAPVKREFISPDFSQPKEVSVGCAECGWQGRLDEVVWVRL